jgi:hypothetical protein
LQTANEMLQWGALAVVTFLLLGVLRQISLLLPASGEAEHGGPRAGRKLERDTYSALSTPLGQPTPNSFLVAFVTESCAGCQRLLARQSEDPISDRSLVVVALKPSDHFAEALGQLGAPWVADTTGDLWKSCGVTSTPLVLEVERGGRVMRKDVAFDVKAFAAAA